MAIAPFFLSIGVDKNHLAAYKRISLRSEGFAWVAQLVEQRTENPRVGGSIPSPGTISA